MSGVDVGAEIESLRKANEHVYRDCIQDADFKINRQNYMFAGYGYTKSFALKQLNNTICRAMALPELSFDRYLKGVFPVKVVRPTTKRQYYQLLYNSTK